MLNIYNEANLVRDYNQEYFKLINFYQNLSRNSIFVKYYNINNMDSSFDERTDVTYDDYVISKVMFDIYELTPAYSLQAIQNRSTNNVDLKGQMASGMSSIVVYTINRPKIHDLVTFYVPISGHEIFRVINFTVATNALHISNNSVTFFELELDYAPLKTLVNLKVSNRYVYDLSVQKNISKQEYDNKFNFLNKCVEILKILNKFYSPSLDLYICNSQIPVILNELIVFFKRLFSKEYQRIFENVLFPYGYFEKLKILNSAYNDLKSFPFNNLTNDTYYYYDINNLLIEEYYWRDKTKYNNEFEEALYYTLQLWSNLIEQGY